VISTNAYTKSSHSGGGSCVEVRLLAGDSIGVRDSKDISQAPLVFTRPEWEAFLAGVRDGEFDLSELM
jgi:Domain of unknown function (DUF397)